jgi:myo-inositol-1(or 4)-monophosphatase
MEVAGGYALRRSILAFCHGRDKASIENVSKIFRAVKSVNASFRQMGSSELELCLVAAGRIEGYVSVGLKPWDVAAGALIVKEAGGRVTDFQGREFTLGSANVLATNGRVHGEMLRLIGDSLGG